MSTLFIVRWQLVLIMLFIESVLLPIGAAAQWRTNEGAQPALATGVESMHRISVDGKQRLYVVHIPLSHPEHPALVINMHGGGGTAMGWEKVTGMD
jgi:poly(3-hydroxybutyrate) depolymerase